MSLTTTNNNSNGQFYSDLVEVYKNPAFIRIKQRLQHDGERDATMMMLNLFEMICSKDPNASEGECIRQLDMLIRDPQARRNIVQHYKNMSKGTTHNLISS